MTNKSLEKHVEFQVDKFENSLNLLFESKIEKVKSDALDRVQHISKSLNLSTLEREDLENIFDMCLVSWHWHLKTSIKERFMSMFEKHKNLFEFIDNKAKNNQDIKILDLGCGFCPYWPIFQNLGITSFCGIDMFGNRQKEKHENTNILNASHSIGAYLFLKKENSLSREQVIISLKEQIGFIYRVFFNYQQKYQETAKDVIDFFNIKDARIIQENVFDCDYVLSKEDEKSFDIILSFYPGPTITKEKIPGIPREKFDKIVEKYLSKDGIFIFNEK